MPDNYNSIFDTYHTFNSLFDIYPDKIHTGAVYGYRNSDGTLLEFPCTLDVSRAVKDEKGRWTASGLGLKPAFVKYSDALKRLTVRKAWIGDGFTGSGTRSPSNKTIEEVRFLDDITSIGWGAFGYCTVLTSITIPDCVTSIGDWAFYYCSSLTSITIPANVTSIGYEAFANCTNLTNVTIPNSVTYIEEEAFYGCSSLIDIFVNQTESTLLDSASVPSGCTIHWNSAPITHQ